MDSNALAVDLDAVAVSDGGGAGDIGKGGVGRERGYCEQGGYGSAQSYARKLVTVLSGCVFGSLDSVLERHSFDEFGEVV